MQSYETPTHRQNAASWWSIILFLLLVNVVTWVACFLLRSQFTAGHLWALFAFIFITVWSPTVISLALSLRPNDRGGSRTLLGLLFRRPAGNAAWYLIAIILPVASVVIAILVARLGHNGAPFLPFAALPLTLTLQITTGAAGEELGWRGFLLTRLGQ